MGNRLVKNVMTGMAILSTLGMAATPALADIPKGTVIFNDGEAFDLTYANDPSHLSAIQHALTASNNKIWVKAFDGSIVDNMTNQKVDPSTIPAVKYLDATGKETDYDAGDGPVHSDAAVIKSVSAVNGTITVTLDKAPATAPAAGDFKVTQAIDGAAATDLTPTVSVDTTGAVVTLAVTQVVATTADQSVVYSVSYKTGTAMAAAAVKVAADPELTAEGAATNAVTALETAAKADLTVSANLTAAETAVTTATSAVANVNDATVKADLTTRLTAATKTVTDARTAFDAAVKAEADAEAAAETAVAKAETSKLSADITAAQTAVAAVKDTTKAAAFTARINAIVPILEVSNVSAITTKQVQVTFSKSVDPTSAQAGANYVIGGAALVADPNGAVLQPDGKTVILNITGDPGLTNFQSYTLTVSNVKDTNGNKISAISKTFTVNDALVPSVASVTPKGNTTIVIKFSEPVKNVNSVNAPNLRNIQLDGAVIPTANLVGGVPTISADGTTATLVFTGALTAGDHKISILQAGAATDIMAYVGYKVPSVTQTITVVPDTSAASVTSITANSQTSVTVTFSKPVNINTATDLADFYWNQSNSAADMSKTADKITTTDNQTYVLSFTAASKPLISGSVYFFVTGVKDYSGNGIAGNVAANTYGTSIAVPANALPSVASLSSKGNNTIYVNYNTAMDPTTARNTANYLVKDSLGNTINVTNADWVTGTTDQKQIQLTTAAMTTGTYNVAISGVKDVVGNTLSAPTNSVSVTDTSSPQFNAISRNGNAITVTYTRAMSITGTNSVLNVANYQFTPASTGVEGNLPPGTTITAFNSNKSVLITIPAATAVANGDAVTIGYLSGTTLYTVADANGNLYTPDPVAGHAVGASANAVTIGDGAGAALKIADSSTLKMTIPSAQSALANVYASDFNISIDAGATWVTPVAATLDSTDKNNKTIIFTMPSGTSLSSSLTVAGKIRVKTSATPASTDVYGIKLTQAVSTEGAALAPTNGIAPALVSAAFVSPTQINVTFSGTLADADKAADSIQIVQGSKVLSGHAAGPVQGKLLGTLLAGNVVEFQLNAADALDPTQAITVRTVSADFMTASDGTNLLVANTTGVSVATFAASNVDLTVAAGAVANNDHFDVTFNRNIDLTTIVTGWTNGLTAQTATMTFNADGTANISGANVGTFTGLSVFTGGNATVQLTSTTPNTLTITVTAIGNVVATDNGVLKFTPVSSIKSATGTSIGSYQVASIAAIDEKPFIVTAKSKYTTITNQTAWKDAGNGDAAAVGTTLLTNLEYGAGPYTSGGVANGDTITINGKVGGTAITAATYSVTATSKVSDLLSAINTAFGLSSGNVTISAGGNIVIDGSTDGKVITNVVISDGTAGAANFNGKLTDSAANFVDAGLVTVTFSEPIKVTANNYSDLFAASAGTISGVAAVVTPVTGVSTYDVAFTQLQPLVIGTTTINAQANVGLVDLDGSQQAVAVIAKIN